MRTTEGSWLDCRQKLAALVELTEDAIRAAAREENAEYPEALPLIDTGRPALLLIVSSADRAGRTYRVTGTPYVMAPLDGREVHIGARPPVVLLSGERPRDRRLSFLEDAKRRLAPQLRGARAAVEWMER